MDLKALQLGIPQKRLKMGRTRMDGLGRTSQCERKRGTYDDLVVDGRDSVDSHKEWRLERVEDQTRDRNENLLFGSGGGP